MTARLPLVSPASTAFFTPVRAVILALALVFGSGQIVASSMSSPPNGDGLVENAGNFVLNRPIADFYDSAFVLSHGVGSLPRIVNVDELADTLLDFDVIFYGENHRHPGVHLQQQRLFKALHDRFPSLILSMEQFERDVQPVVDDFLAGKIGEANLIEKGRAWDQYRSSYAPLVLFAKDNNLPVIAAEAPAWTIACIGQWGPEILAQLTPVERGHVASELHLTAGTYRDKYLRFQAASITHGGGKADTADTRLKAERSFAAQATRDDSMAESIFRAMQRFPGRKVLHLNGNFHSAAFLGTVERLQLRAPNLKIAVISTLEVSNRKTPAFPKEALADGTALQLVYPSPPDFAAGEDQGEWVRKMMSRRVASNCKYALAPPEAGVEPPAPGASQ
jgi:uncharacterized iron-regulated protein